MMNKNKIIRAGNYECYDNNIIHSILNITDYCNFNCPYCSNVGSRKNNILDTKILHDFLEDIGLRNAEEYRFSVSGGEPLLYPYLDEMLNYMETLLPNDPKVIFITNGSLIYKNRYLIERYLSSLSIDFVVTIHLNNKSLHKLVDEIEYLNFKDHITIKILAAPGQIDFIEPIIKRFKNMGIEPFIGAIFGDNLQPMAYDEKELEFLKNYNARVDPIIFHEIDNAATINNFSFTKLDKFLNPDFFSYKGMKCAAGLNTLRLGSNGYAIPCFGAARSGNRYNLKKRRLRDIPELSKPMICPSNRCNCEIFLKAPKWRDERDRPKYINS